MSHFKSPNFGERLDTAANAKKAALERFRVKSAANDPGLAERKAARLAAQAARDTRDAERRTTRLDAKALEAAEQAAREVEHAEQAARQITQEREQATREAVRDAERRAEILAKAAAKANQDIATQAEQKTARDARYAARKARR
jgi:hypothetical protein